MKRRQFLQGTAAAALFAPAMTRGAFAQAANATVMKMAPQANLTSLDPIWTTATVTNNHGYYVYDTLYSSDAQMRPQPQMAEGHEVSDDGRTWRIRLRPGGHARLVFSTIVAPLGRWTVRLAGGVPNVKFRILDPSPPLT